MGIGLGRTTDDIVDIVNMYDSANIKNMARLTNPIISVNKPEETNLGDKLDLLTREVKKIKMSVNLDLDTIQEVMELKIEKNGKKKSQKVFL